MFSLPKWFAAPKKANLSSAEISTKLGEAEAAHAAAQARVEQAHTTLAAERSEGALAALRVAKLDAEDVAAMVKILRDDHQAAVERERQAERAMLRGKMGEAHEACANHYSAAAELTRDRGALLLEAIAKEQEALAKLEAAKASRADVVKLAAELGESPPPELHHPSPDSILCDYLAEAQTSATGGRHRAIHNLISAIDPGFWRLQGLQRGAQHSAELSAQRSLERAQPAQPRVVNQVVDLRGSVPLAESKYAGADERQAYRLRRADAQARMTTAFCVGLECSVTLSDGSRLSSLAPVTPEQMHPAAFRAALRDGSIMERLTEPTANAG